MLNLNKWKEGKNKCKREINKVENRQKEKWSKPNIGSLISFKIIQEEKRENAPYQYQQTP